MLVLTNKFSQALHLHELRATNVIYFDLIRPHHTLKKIVPIKSKLVLQTNKMYTIPVHLVHRQLHHLMLLYLFVVVAVVYFLVVQANVMDAS